MTGNRKRVQASAGTRTAWGAVRTFFRTPSDGAAASDRDALARGEGRALTCFLKGSVDPYPRRSRQGTLELTRDEITWRASWGIPRRAVPINEHVQSVEVRQADRSEWNVKKGGKAFGVLPVPEFLVIVCKTDRGVLELSVPSADVPLVQAALGH